MLSFDELRCLNQNRKKIVQQQTINVEMKLKKKQTSLKIQTPKIPK